MARAVQTHPVAFPAAQPRPAAGRVELAVAEAAVLSAGRPQRVSGLLVAGFAEIAGEPATRDLVRRLSAGTREWLLHRLAVVFRPDLTWFEAVCTHCASPYDLALSLATAPRKPAGPGFPVAAVDTSLGPRRFEAPNGGHEESLARARVAGTAAAPDPRRHLVALSGLAETAAADAERFTEADLARIDEALEAVAPEVADSAGAVCPACRAETQARIEPLVFAFPKLTAVLHDVHLLAGAYGWSEDAVLALPAQRRRSYAGLIARDRRAAGPSRRAWP